MAYADCRNTAALCRYREQSEKGKWIVNRLISIGGNLFLFFADRLEVMTVIILGKKLGPFFQRGAVDQP